MGQSTTSLSLSDPAGTIAVAPTAGPDAAATAAVVFCATLRMHLAHSVWKQLSKHGSVYLCPQLWNSDQNAYRAHNFQGIHWVIVDNMWKNSEQLRNRTWHRSRCSDIAETSDEGTGKTSSPLAQCIKR